MAPVASGALELRPGAVLQLTSCEVYTLDTPATSSLSPAPPGEAPEESLNSTSVRALLQQPQRILAGAAIAPDGGSRSVAASASASASASAVPCSARGSAAREGCSSTRGLLQAGVVVEMDDVETLPAEALAADEESSPVEAAGDEQGEGYMGTWPVVQGSTVVLKNSLILYPCEVRATNE